MEASTEIMNNKWTFSVPETVEDVDAGLIIKFVIMSVTYLLIGTIQGVIQTLPEFALWIRATGPAGHMIDPLAHAHINLVGGVTMAIMGLFYYILPRILNRPIYSQTLSNTSFWFSTIGVLAFFSSLVFFGILEGNMILDGMTFQQALDTVGPIHHISIITAAILMGFGYWLFIVNIFLTVFKRKGGK